MRIKKLEIFGFKSFASRQSLQFGEGITGIVGPNGCGKSNVVDALRWVMGEQNARHLRGGNMQDIIFCGAEKKAPLGYAEVILTIENNEQDAPLEYNHYQEIEIARRLYKTGESEYEINRKSARLKDISEFFLGTGVGTKAYSIIEQGRVNDIVSAKPADRRLIIEEAAGITKYKAKKATAERRMEATRVNLNRIVDIKNEVDKRVAVLLREKEKLLKVKELKSQIRRIDLHISSHRYLAIKAHLSFLQNHKEAMQREIDENRQSTAQSELVFAKILKGYSDKHEQKRLLFELENQHKSTWELLKKDLDYVKITLEQNQIFLQRINAQLEDIETRKQDLNNNLGTYKKEQESLKNQFVAISAELTTKQENGRGLVEKRHANLVLEKDQQRKIIDTATNAARLQAEILTLKDSDAQKQIDIKNTQIEYDAEIKTLGETKVKQEAMTEELAHGLSRKNILEKNLEDIDLKLDQTNKAIHKLKNDQNILSQKKMTLESRLKSLLDIDARLEWSDSGVADLLNSPMAHVIKGVIADVIKAKPGHEDIVEKCLAPILDAALLRNNRDLTSVADFLKKTKSAQTSFFLLDGHAKTPNLSRPLGLKSLQEFVVVADEFKELLTQFARFYLADNLSIALEHWPAAQMAQATIVSLSGEILLADGQAIVLGHNNEKGILKRKHEISLLKNEVLSASEAWHDLNTTLKTSLDQRKISDENKEKCLIELKPLNFGIVRLEEALKQKQAEVIKIEANVSKLKEKYERLLNQATNQDEKIAGLNSQWAQALEHHKNYEEELASISSLRSVIEADFETFHQEIKSIEISKMSVKEKLAGLETAIDQTRKNLEHLALQEQDFSEQSSHKAQEDLKLKESERQTEKKIASLQKELLETSAMLEAINETCAKLSEEKQIHEKELADLQLKGRALFDQLHKEDLAINNAQNDLNNICDRIRDRYRAELAYEISDFHDQAIDEANAKKESVALEKAVERLGSVNENAAVEYDELFLRGQFLESQITDLNNALLQLESAIKKINKTTMMRFHEAYININRQFSKVFSRLFNGGKAELVLSNEEDLLNCGVDIIAQPPGKNIGSIDLMSGGEKALTAISLIMAIFLIKPSPFCLLDEVDAPLDETNVSRFSQLIKDMSELSQFIVITHNRKTMESADRLYGVTMEDAGMSKVVSVHVEQAFLAVKSALPQNKPTQLFLNDI